jgi:hypothetical protein
MERDLDEDPKGKRIMNKPLVTLSAALCAILLSTGCYRYAVKVGRGGDVGAAPAKTVWSHHFVAGLAGDAELDVASVCPSNDATVTIERNVIDSLISGATGLMWEPSTVEVYCAGGGVASLEIDADRARRLVASPLFEEAVATLAPDKLAALDEARRDAGPR